MSGGWDELRERLAQENLEVAPKGGGLVIRSLDAREDLCKASEAGHGYSNLIRKFGSGHPDHDHVWLADRILGKMDKDT